MAKCQSGTFTTFFFLSILWRITCAQSLSDVVESDQETCYCVQELLYGLNGPLSMSFYLESGVQMAVVVEQMGIAGVYSMSGQRVRPFLDISSRVVISNDNGESRGLLSLVFDPLFNGTGNVYVYYIRRVNDKEYAYVSVFQARDGTVDPNSEKFLLRIFQPYQHGNGGPMLFGDDGFLYIFTGDGGEEDDRSGKAQSMNTLHGKVLRIQVMEGQDFLPGEAGPAKLYATPDTNPFKGSQDGGDEIYALGVRNMWGCSLDSVRRGGSGRIFCAETGTVLFDEIVVIEEGKNYGWPIKEGNACYKASTCSPIVNEGLPIFEFAHKDSHALVGGYVYRGKLFPWMSKHVHYAYGDVLHGKTYLLEESIGGVWTSRNWSQCDLEKCPSTSKAVLLDNLRAWGQDMQGELYLLMTKDLVATKATGKVFKIVPPSR
ncbi:HHIP-like protein 1 [Aplysia californica]|uniref:HHIP-like protein 1 n=1 Tax=Aplysia californica TaxID=6500 RepID=A0ABM1A4Q8_APLCA|nr:HHIP-like protein 1 [Aplysia californica]